MAMNGMASSLNKAACPRLWDSAFIDKDGQVYACCHYLPRAIGNIHDTSLDQIRRGDIANRLREEALAEGTLCFSFCSILTNQEKRDAVMLTDPALLPLRRLHILFGEGCSLACMMCHQDHRSGTMLNASLVLSNAVPEDCTSIEIQGGEPLQLKESRKYLEAIVERGWAPTIITNGMHLSGKISEVSVLGCSRIKISLNAATAATHEAVNRGSSWARVIENLRNATRIKSRLKRGASLIGRMTLVPQNLSEVAAFIPLCAELGLNAVEYGYDARSIPAVLAADPLLLMKLKQEIREAYNKFKHDLEIQTHRLEKLGLWTATE